VKSHHEIADDSEEHQYDQIADVIVRRVGPDKTEKEDKGDENVSPEGRQFGNTIDEEQADSNNDDIG